MVSANFITCSVIHIVVRPMKSGPTPRKVKTLRIPLATAVAVRVLKSYLPGDFTIVDAIGYLKRPRYFAEVLQAFNCEAAQELISAQHFTEKYHAVVMTSTRENITKDDLQAASRTVESLVRFFSRFNDCKELEDEIDRIVEAYYKNRGGDEK